jgi:leukotriene-A4 hydrolase
VGQVHSSRESAYIWKHNFLTKKQYFTTWKFKSLDSYDFKVTLLDFFASDAEASKKLNDLDWDTWFYKPGYPPKPDYDTSLVDACYALADKWKNRASVPFDPSYSDIKSWMANQSVVFLEKIQTFETPLRAEDVELMGKTYGYDKSENVELVSRYFGVGLAARDTRVYEPTAELLGKVGRMKFVRPLYRALESCDRKLALKTFEKNKEFYHPICRGLVEKYLYGK